MEKNKRNAQNSTGSDYGASRNGGASKNSYNSRVDSSDKTSGASSKTSSHASDYSPNANDEADNSANNRSSGNRAR